MPSLLCLARPKQSQSRALLPPRLSSLLQLRDHTPQTPTMNDVFERYRVEERNPLGAGTGIWKLPKASGPQWASDIIRRFHVMDDDKVNAYVAANFDNFWKKYDNNGTGEIYETEGEVFMRALLGPNNRFRLAPGALSDMENDELWVPNEFSATPDHKTGPYVHRYNLDDGPFGNGYNKIG